MAKLKDLRFQQQLESKELRKRAWHAYCEHVANGRLKQSFTYEEDGIGINYYTMWRQQKHHPEDCDPLPMEHARNCNAAYWEAIGHGLLTGKLKGSPMLWISNMQNRFGWNSILQQSKQEEFKFAGWQGEAKAVEVKDENDK